MQIPMKVTIYPSLGSAGFRPIFAGTLYSSAMGHILVCLTLHRCLLRSVRDLLIALKFTLSFQEERKSVEEGCLKYLDIICTLHQLL